MILNSLPIDFTERLQAILPETSLKAFEQQFVNDLPLVWRVNRLAATPEDVVQRLQAADIPVETTDSLPDALIIPREHATAASALFIDTPSPIYPQGLASQLAAPILNPQPGERILDLAAAPGGKTSHLAALMTNEGQVSAVEVVKARFFKLQQTLKSQGVTIGQTYCRDGRRLPLSCHGVFDRVMLDAPCSSESRFCAETPATFEYWSTKKIRDMVRKQKALLNEGWRCLKSGGQLLYATCTFAPEENEGVLTHFLKKHPEARVLPIDCPSAIPVQDGLTSWQDRAYHPDCVHACRVLPGAVNRGFFMTLLEKP